MPPFQPGHPGSRQENRIIACIILMAKPKDLSGSWKNVAMIPAEPLINLDLLNAMIREIMSSELLPYQPGKQPAPLRHLRQSHAEIVDERLFRRTLLTMPRSRAVTLIQLIQPKFLSRRFSENCFVALRPLDSTVSDCK